MKRMLWHENEMHGNGHWHEPGFELLEQMIQGRSVWQFKEMISLA